MTSTRTALRLAFAAALALSAAPAGAAPAPQPTPHLALVIGNSAYTAMPALPDCTASSHLLSAALRRAGFEVTERLDLTNGQMGGAIGSFADMLGRTPGATSVAYVCGYVAGLDGRPFLLPVSASLERDSDALTQGIVAKSLFDVLARSGVASGLALIDAQPRPGGAGPLGLDKLAERPPQAAVALAAATATGGQPQGPTPLAAALAEALAAPGVETGALLDELRRKLGADSGTTLAVLPAANRIWLVGGPPAPPARAEPSPPPAPAPAPMPAPAAPPAAATPAPRAAPAVMLPDEDRMTDADRRQVQGALRSLGYYDGAVDGIFGPDTRAAIRRWQHEIGADMTGRITADQATRLLARLH